MNTIPFIRQSTWASIGNEIPMEYSAKVEDALAASSLNWKVEKQNIYLADNTLVPNKMACVANIDGASTPLGIVSTGYEVVQNVDAFAFADYISDDVRFVKSGITHTGMVFLIGEMPEVTVLDDSFKPYVIFQNSFNGRYNLAACITPLRVVCQNQFAVSFQTSTNKIALRHSAQIESKLADAKMVLAGVAGHMARISAMANDFAKIKLSSSQVEQAMRMLFPIPAGMKDILVAKVQEKRKIFTDAYNADDNANHRGSAWGLVNAYTDFATHYIPNKTKQKDTLFLKNMDNTTDTIIDIVKAVA